MTEDLTPEPEDPYGISKYAVELDLRAAWRQFGLPFICFRPHNVYGERQNIGDKYRNVVGIFMNQILQGKPMTIFGDGEQTRAFSSIDDVAPVIARSPLNEKAYGETFNVGGDVPSTVNKLARIVADAMGVQPDIQHLQARKEVKHAFASHEKIRGFFELPPPTRLEDGIGRMAAWVRRVGSRRTKPFAAIEVSRGLPEGWAS
jgi:UDP-glucose 4-epimerase